MAWPIAEQVSVSTAPPAPRIVCVSPRLSASDFTAREVKTHRLQLELMRLPSSRRHDLLDLLERRVRATDHDVVDVRIARARVQLLVGAALLRLAVA